jgi:arylsulfatase A-like enzyme
MRVPILLTAIWLAGPGLAFADGSEAQSTRPNIIFLMSDDQSVDTMGCYGNMDVKTPNLDKLAEGGMVFENYYNTTAICMASRATVFTGLYEYRTGCNFGHGHLQAETWEEFSYAVHLKEAGYLTAFAGKFGFVVQGANQSAAFDFWGSGGIQSKYETAQNRTMAKYAEEYPHSTLSYAAFAEDVMEAAVEKDKAFCLSISFKAPHRPWTPDPQFDDLYTGFEFTRRANFGREHAAHLSEQSKQGRQWERWTQWDYDDDFDAVMAQYHELIYGIDVAVGRIRESLERLGLAENTVIIYTSDNGFLNGAHGFGGKVLPLEESARAPLMVLDPREPAATGRSEALVGNIDIAPTILDLAGVAVPEGMDGLSMVPVLKDPQADIREHMAFINAWPRHMENTSLTVLTEDWKYTWWWFAGDGMEPVEDLFNTKEDPLELTNLAGDPAHEEMLQTMRTLYDHHLQAWKDNVVDYNDYERFGTLFDREISWNEKQPFLKAASE